MKICWDNLEGFKLSMNGNLKKGSNIYVEMDKCIKCGELYLTPMNRPNNTCSKSCGLKGRKFSAEHLKNMSVVQMGKKQSKETLIKKSLVFSGKNNPMYGKKRSQRVKDAISKANYKGGFTDNGLASYDTYNEQISYAEETRLKIINEAQYLEVKCTYCGKWYIPKSFEVRARKNSLEGKRKGESLFYCSDDCKSNCTTYHQKKYHRGFKKVSSRDVDPYTRKLCFERDDWQCQRCFSEKNLQCHHIKSYSYNKIIANDIDNCITLCKKCHKEVHKEIGCRFVDLHCKEDT